MTDKPNDTSIFETWLRPMFDLFEATAHANPAARSPRADLYVSDFGPITFEVAARVLEEALSPARLEAMLKQAASETYGRGESL